MKTIILLVALVFMAALRLQAEICPLWNAITVTTSDPGQTVTIQAGQDAKRLTNVVVSIGANEMSVPASELKDATDPQLHTLRFGYWTKDLKRFYVFVTCGRLNSSPYGKQPKDLYFYFDNGKFSGVQSSPTLIRKDVSTEPTAGGDGKPAPQP
jgi:hypothetical protein